MIRFNKALNIKGFTRRIGTKIVRVDPHSRKASVLRVRAALEDASKHKVEVGYVVSKSGKLSQMVTQNNPNQVQYKFKDKLLPYTAKNSATIHNHPDQFPKLKLTANPPSGPDIVNNLHRGDYGFVADAQGSQFRYSRGAKFDKAGEFETIALINKTAKQLSKFKERIQKMDKLSPDQKLMTQDRLYQRLNKEGLIRYRVRPTPELKVRREKFQANADKVLDWIFRD